MAETKLAQEPLSGLIYRWQAADQTGELNFLLFHGLTGNEDVMWVLQSALPAGAFVAAPRAPFPLEGDNGFSWADPARGDGYSGGGLQAGLEAASAWVRGVLSQHSLDLAKTVYVGFSQGSALAFLLAGQGAAPPAALVSLAGYLPEGELQLDQLQVFWGHGSRDQTIPVTRAQQDVDRLKDLGAVVHYCEADVGHKVGLECLRGLKDWLQQVLK